MMTNNWFEKWRNEADRNLRIILEEFRNLSAHQLNYSSHIQQCSIIEIMMNLAKVNDHMLSLLEIRRPQKPRIKEFRINNVRMLILHYTQTRNCRKGQKSGYTTDVFELLENQQQKLKALIINLNDTDLNCRPGALRISRILKLTVGESIEYLMYRQWQHIIQARRILMLQ